MSEEKIVVNIDPDLKDLIPGFLENRGKDIENMKSALSANDSDSLKSIGHSIKGVGGGYGFAEITEIGAEIEECARLNDMESITKLIDNLADYLSRVEIKYQ
ncbi:MAG: Hpt domain-containing protein [Calditrichia bacterium]